MPKCIGPIDGVCPSKKTGKNVDCYGEDLWLCKKCKEIRFSSDDITLLKARNSDECPDVNTNAKGNKGDVCEEAT